MKTVAVCDHYMTEDFYNACFDKFDDLELIATPYFGPHDRDQMRALAHKLEHEGAYSFPVPDEVFAVIPEAEVLMVHLCPVTAQLMDSAPKLKYILTNRGGLENIDVEAARARGIHVINNPAHNGNAVAELAICLMICEMRNVQRSFYSIKTGEWRDRYDNFGRVFELRNKTVGIIGFGTIGRLVAEKLQTFHVKLIAADPNVTPDDPDLARFNVTLTDTDTVLSTADIVTVHARLEDKSQILGPRELDLIKPSAIFVNTARAYLVDYDHLAKMLIEKRLAGAALEVFPPEPLPSDSPFLTLDNVSMTNHRGGDPVNCFSDSPEMLVGFLHEHLSGKTPKFLVC